MDLINEYALLAAVAAPVIVIAVMNMCLANEAAILQAA